MAIFGKHIKGTGNATENSDGLGTGVEGSQVSTDTLLAAGNNAPFPQSLSSQLHVKVGNGSSNEGVNLGHIVTTNINVETYGSGKHRNQPSTWCDNNNNPIFVISPAEDKCTLSGFTYLDFDLVDHNKEAAYEGQFDGKTTMKIGTEQYTVNVPTDINGYTHIVNSELKVDQKCEALYFNATSDKRAKENIQPATFSGLDLINKLSLYTFNYKSSTDTVPGVLAQDLLEVQPEGLDLVDNIHARGKDNDYMSIKETKLIFVLMQAIKEQQTQIEELKLQIQKLESK